MINESNYSRTRYTIKYLIHQYAAWLAILEPHLLARVRLHQFEMLSTGLYQMRENGHAQFFDINHLKPKWIFMV